MGKVYQLLNIAKQRSTYILLSSVLILSQLFLASTVQAYSSAYFLAKTPLNQVLQPTQVVREKGATYVSEYGGNIVYKIEGGQNFGILGTRGRPSILAGPTSIDVDNSGNVYIADPNNRVVRVVHPNGTTDVIAGNGQTSSNREDSADATQTAFNFPSYVKVGPDGLLYVVDQGVIRRIEADGSTTHLVGEFNNNNVIASKVAFDSQNTLFFTTDTSIYKLNSNNSIEEYYVPTDNEYTVEEVAVSEKSLLGTVAGFDIDSQDRIWMAISNIDSVYDDNGNFRYTKSAVIYFEDGIVHTAAGGGNTIISNTVPGFGSDMILGRLAGLSVGDDQNIYFINTDLVFNPYPQATGNYIGRLSINSDVSPPAVSHSLSSEPNEHGWFNRPVELTWSLEDPESNITYQLGCTSALFSEDSAGYNQPCNALSNGGITYANAYFRIDQQKPVISSVSFTQNPKPVNSESEFIITASDSGSYVRNAEYYIGESDPGLGEGTSLGVSEYLSDGYVRITGTIGSNLATGAYKVNIRAQDHAGNWSLTTAEDLTVSANVDPQIFSLIPSSDTYIRNGQTNRNHGGDAAMIVQSSGQNRSLVRFDQNAIESTVNGGEIISAKLRLKITDNGNNWGTTGRTIDIHRMLVDWAEGNGTDANRGTGAGATWDCAVDSNIFNQAKDCTGIAMWEMGQPNNPSVHPWLEAASATALIQNNQSDVIEFDVTSDLIAYLSGSTNNYGWLIKKTNEGQNGQVSFGTRESSLTPELVVTYQP